MKMLAHLLLLTATQLTLPAVALELLGPRVSGTLLRGQTAPGTTVEFQGRNIRVSPGGLFLIGFGRDESGAFDLRVTLADGRVEHLTLSIEKREYAIQRIDGLPPAKVTPDPKHLARIRREGKLVKRARSADDPRAEFGGGFHRPAHGRISGVYGSQRVLNGQPRRPHYGLDIAAPMGAPVTAPAGGQVTLAEPDLYFSGGTLILDHGHGLTSSFLHLSKILVSHGEQVTAGQLIAQVGKSGRATGPHLDWRMNLFDKRLDPQLLIEGNAHETRAQPAGR